MAEEGSLDEVARRWGLTGDAPAPQPEIGNAVIRDSEDEGSLKDIAKRWGLEDKSAADKPTKPTKPGNPSIIGGTTDTSITGGLEEFVSGLGRGAENLLATLADGIGLGVDAAATELAKRGIIEQADADKIHELNKGGFEYRAQSVKDWEAAHGSNPYAFAGKIGGEITSTGGPMLKAAQIGGKVLQKMGPRVAENMLTKVTAAAAGGATATALTSSGYDEPIENQMLFGAAAGATFGVLAPATVKAGMRAWRSVVGGEKKVSREAVARLTELLQQEGITPAQAKARLKRRGGDTTIADLSPKIAAEAGSLVATPTGAGSTKLINVMTKRAKQAGRAMKNHIDDTLGPRPDVTLERDRIIKRGRSEAEPFYKIGRDTKQPLDMSDVGGTVQDLLAKNPVGSERRMILQFEKYMIDDDATKVARQTVRDKAEVLGRKLSKAELDDVVVYKTDIEDLHKVRQEMDGALFNAKGAIKSEKSATNNALNSGKDIRAALDRAMKTNEGYAKGDAIFAGEQQVKDALDMGKAAFDDKTLREDLVRFIQTASEAEVEALKIGARWAVSQRVERAARGDATQMAALFAKAEAPRQKLLAIFGPSDARKVFSIVDDSVGKRAVESKVAQGSDTAARTATQRFYEDVGGTAQKVARVGTEVIAGVGAAASTGNWLHFFPAFMGVHAINKTLEGSAKRTGRAVQDDVARLLSKGGAAAQEALDAAEMLFRNLPREQNKLLDLTPGAGALTLSERKPLELTVTGDDVRRSREATSP